MTDKSVTLRGTGWLRESPRNLVPAEWLAVRSRSALRKCMFLPAAAPAPWQGKPGAPTPVRHEHKKKRQELPQARHPDALRHARIFPAEPDARRVPPLTPRRAWAEPPPHAAHASALDSPVALGLLLIMLPPVGVAAVWASPRYERDAQWALTFTSALFMALVAIAVITLAR